MKSLVISVVFLCLLFSSAQLQAQTWSPAEKEVIQAIEDCVRAYKEEDLEAFMACYHDDFVGFQYGQPSTRNKADVRKSIPLGWANSDVVESWTKPLNILIVGDVAIIHYYDHSLERDKEGKEKSYRYRWTDIMAKQSGRWLWIADHGGLDPGVKPSGE